MSEINDRIAKAKGWTWEWCHFEIEEDHAVWVNPDGYAAMRPDYVGTLEGVAGMMRELGHAWVWYFDERILKWCCHRRYYDERVGTGGQFQSPEDRPGDCVGEAYLSMKEVNDDD